MGARMIHRMLKTVASFLPTVVRILMGVLLIVSGWSVWLTRPDAAGYLADAINPALDAGRPFGFYEAFLRSVVVPHFGLFAGLVGWGEFLSGLSLTVGAASRLGAGVISFQFLNYGLLNGFPSLFSHGIMIILIGIPVFFQSARRFGVDKWLYARWPRARVW